MVPDIVGWREQHNEWKGGARKGGMGMPTSTDFLISCGMVPPTLNYPRKHFTDTHRSVSQVILNSFYIYYLLIHTTQWTYNWRSEDKLQEWVLFFTSWGMGIEHDDQTWGQVPLPT